MVTGYIFTLLITRNFGAGTMGIFALSFAVLTVFSIIGRLGFLIPLHGYTYKKKTELKIIRLALFMAFNFRYAEQNVK